MDHLKQTEISQNWHKNEKEWKEWNLKNENTYHKSVKSIGKPI